MKKIIENNKILILIINFLLISSFFIIWALKVFFKKSKQYKYKKY